MIATRGGNYIAFERKVMTEDERYDQLSQLPTRLVRKLAMKWGLNATASIARLRYQLSEIEGVLEDEKVVGQNNPPGSGA